MKLNKGLFSLYFWVIPIFFALHNGEEYYFFPQMKYLQSIHMKENIVQEKQFLIAIILLTIFVFAVVLVHYFVRRQLTLYSVLLAQSIIFINGFFHIGGAIVTKGYVPGIITAVVLIIPFSIFFFREGIKCGWWRRKHIIISSFAGLVLMLPIIVGTLFIAKLLV